jgi:hypothetical protein
LVHLTLTLVHLCSSRFILLRPDFPGATATAGAKVAKAAKAAKVVEVGIPNSWMVMEKPFLGVSINGGSPKMLGLLKILLKWMIFGSPILANDGPNSRNG